MDIYWSRLEDIFTHLILTHFSLLIWLVWWPWRLLSSHVGNFSKQQTLFFGLGFMQQSWPVLTLVNARSNGPETLPKFQFSKSAFFGTILKARRWLSLGCVDLAAATVYVDRWLWERWLSLTNLVVREGCVTLLVGWLYWDFVDWSIMLTAVMHHHTYIFLACLLLIYWYVLSAFYFLVYVIVAWYWG